MKANNFRPNFMSVGGYDGMHLIYEALKKTNGSTDGEKLVEAMKGMSWTSPRGKMTIDAELRDVVQDVYIRRCERVNGKLWNIEIDKLPRSDPSRNDMAHRNKPPFRADHVGSFLRPKALLDAREKLAKGEITKADLRKVEDEAIRDVVKYQEDLGLEGITDGEFRRTYFHIDFLEQLDGVETHAGFTSQFHTKTGDVGFAPPVLKVTGKVKHGEADPARGLQVPASRSRRRRRR